jgi:hypothetical protein
MNGSPGSSSVSPKSRLHDNAFDREDLEHVLWEILLNALRQFDALRRPCLPGRAGAAVAEQAGLELSWLLDRQLFTTLLHEGRGDLNRLSIFSEVKADLLTQGASALHLEPRLRDDLSSLIDGAAAPAWKALEGDEYRHEEAAGELRSERFLDDMLPGLEDWSFVESAGPRMHLEWVGSQHRVWLERRGRRAFEPAAPLGPAVLGLLERRLGKVATRAHLECSWARWMLLHGWLDVEWESEQSLVLHAYPNLSGAFQRRVFLQGLGPDSRPLCPQDIRLSRESGALVLWGERHFPLSGLLWDPDASGQLRVSPSPASVVEPRLEPAARARFKDAIEHGLGDALLLHYHRALLEKNGYSLPEADRDDQRRGDFTCLLGLDNDEQHAHDSRRAYAEVVVSLTQKDAAFRHGATARLLRDLGLSHLPRRLDRGDTAAFWTQVDDALEEEWTDLGFAVEERLKAGWRRRPQYPLRDVPSGYTWWWASGPRFPRRMHLRSTSYEHRVWLEKDGRRAFEPDGPIDEAILGPLRRAVKRQRAFYDARWCRELILRDWLKVEWASDTEIALHAYPTADEAFSRRIDLRQHLPGAHGVQEADLLLDAETASVQVRGQGSIPLPVILWGTER